MACLRRISARFGERELAVLSPNGELEAFLNEHDVHHSDPPLTLDMVPPRAPREGETWDSTIHHFWCTVCDWDPVLWDAN